MTKWLSMLLCAGAFVSAAASANDVGTGFGGKPIYIQADEFEDERKRDSWAGQLGLGFVVEPQFIGASDHTSALSLDLQISYKDWLFIENNRLGAVLYRSRFLRTGVIGRWNLGRRDAGGIDAFGNITDVDQAFEVGVFAATSLYKLFLTGEMYFGVSDKLKGSSFELEAGYTFEPDSEWRLTPILGAVWGSSRYQQTFFGVPEGVPGVEAYSPRGGLYQIYGELAAERRLGKNWLLKGSMRVSELLHGAADSPIVQLDGGSREQLEAFAGVVWLF